MSDQQVAAALTAAAVVAAVLVARAAVLHQGRRHAGARVPVRRGVARATVPVTVPDDQTARSAVQEAERYVHHCWQQFQARTDPPE
ncbi:hypothetical protein [Streptomyces galbus]|uniref:Uncharacterized protein n=1 Tax=Streptomyces galbus TaxID=33898 RepID=A0ABX1IDE9_STRGB|nr:hypothetical protein [Streptomyces galbus]NKQ23524.1 hypothetical protein [Streptomyces galbus]